MEFVPSPDTPRDRALEHIDYLNDHHDTAGAMSSEEFSRFIEEAEQLPEYLAYKNQRITFYTLGEVVSLVAGKKDGEGEIVGALVTSIKRGAAHYYDAIVRMARFKRQAYRLEPEEYKDQLIALDQRRRAIHNALITDATAFTRFCNRELPSRAGVVVPQEQLFTSSELADREGLGEWAFDSELGYRIETIITAARAAREKKKGSGSGPDPEHG